MEHVFKTTPVVQALSLNTTPVAVAAVNTNRPSTSGTASINVRISAVAGAGTVSFAIVPKGADAPSVVATFGAGAGVLVLPGSSITFAMAADRDLYVVASAATNTSVAVWS